MRCIAPQLISTVYVQLWRPGEALEALCLYISLSLSLSTQVHKSGQVWPPAIPGLNLNGLLVAG